MSRITITRVVSPFIVLLGAACAFAAGPTITSLSTTSTFVGYAVTITGANFGSSQGSSTVTFNGTTAASAPSISITTQDHVTTGRVAHLYDFCKGGDGKVSCHSFLFHASVSLLCDEPSNALLRQQRPAFYQLQLLPPPTLAGHKKATRSVFDCFGASTAAI